MNKESVFYLSMLEYISNSSSEKKQQQNLGLKQSSFSAEITTKLLFILSVLYFMCGIHLKTQDVLVLFENYCEKLLTEDIF